MKPLFVTITGSKLYGSSTPESDTDFKGFGFPEYDELLGLKSFEQQEYKNGIEDGPEKAEGSIFAVAKYISLCLKGNPTVIEVSFADPQFHVFTTDIGLEIADYVKKNMLTKHLFKPYSAYHRAQMRKMQSMERTGKRAASVEEHGFDPKFGFHTFRLARQCIIVMREGVLRPTLDPEDKEIAMKIRKGKEYFTKESLIELLEKVDVEMYDAYKSSTLPDEPSFNKANSFVLDIQKRYFAGEFDSQLDKQFSLENI